MTKIKCSNEMIFYICRHLKNGYCILDDLEMEFELQGAESTQHWMVCSHADIVTNGSPEWDKFKDNRTEAYR